MKKNNKFNVLSERKCGCGKGIKQNVIDRRPDARECYECGREGEAGRGNIISTAREVKTGKRIGRKKGKYAKL